MTIKLVSFDLDETLISGLKSFSLLCLLNGKYQEQKVIQEKEDSGEIDYVSADYLAAPLLTGLKKSTVAEQFLLQVKPLKNISEVIQQLKKQGITTLIITSGPQAVAEAAAEIWGFDGSFGSEFEIIDGVFTGTLLNFLTAEDKVQHLATYCQKHNIKPQECLAVGDGITDIPLFEFCGQSIAINAKAEVKEQATYAIDTCDLYDILQFIQENQINSIDIASPHYNESV